MGYLPFGRLDACRVGIQVALPALSRSGDFRGRERAGARETIASSQKGRRDPTNKQRAQGNSCVGARRRFAEVNLQHVPSDAGLLEDGRLSLSPSTPYAFRICQFRYLEAVVSRREFCVRRLAFHGLW